MHGMRHKVWVWFIVISGVVGFSFPSSAAKAELDKLIEGIQQQYNRAEDLSADFTQEAYNRTVGRTQKAKGRVFLTKPNLMRWDYDEPDLQHFIIDGETFWWYTPQNNQVVKKPASTSFDSKLPLSFLGGVGNLRQDFYISYAQEKINKRGWSSLLLLPREPTINLKQLLMDVERFEIRRISMEDAFGNRTTIFLSNMRVNRHIPSERFRFVLPPGVQVITPQDFPGGF